MIRGVELRNFRGIVSGELSFASPLTLLVGPNGAGKSSVLEAIDLATKDHPQFELKHVAGRRTADGREERWLINSGRGTSTVKLTADQLVRQVKLESSDGQSVRTDSKIEPSSEAVTGSTNSPFAYAESRKLPAPVRLIEPYVTDKLSLADLYTSAAEQGRRGEVAAFLGELVPGLRDVEIMSRSGHATVYLTYADGSRPAALAGDGVQLLLKLGLELASLSGGVALLEEPETHLHPAAIGIAAKAIWIAVNRGVQVVATTHSIDMIDAIVAGASTGDLEKLSLCRLRLTSGQLACSCLSGADVAFSRSEIQDDLR